MTMFVLYHPGYTVDLAPNHRFPMQKYRLVYERLLAEGSLAQAHVIQPSLATMADLLLVHTRDYVDRFLTGQMSTK
jgi:acetoin utilization deacetylase AcuC-like enzyme